MIGRIGGAAFIFRSKPILTSTVLRTSTSMVQVAAETSNEMKMSKAMKYYLNKKRNHDAFIASQRDEFEAGKRRLADMMGYDSAENMTQEDIDQCIEYLFPSGLHDSKARPMMKPPEEIFPKQKEAEFDYDGRPFQPFFYCVSPNFVQTLYDLVEKYEMIQFLQDRLASQGKYPDPDQILDAGSFSGTRWVSREELENEYLEKISESQYDEFISTLERISDHPMSYRIKDFLMRYRKILSTGIEIKDDFIQPEFDEHGRTFVTAIGRRKSSMAQVKVIKPGTGQISITHMDYPEDVKGINYFPNYLHRHEVMFPLQFTRLLGEVDVECLVYAGGASGQSGAIRYALSSCLRSFVDQELLEEMKLVGLLTQDVRVKERKLFGHLKSRRKRTWRKR